MRDGYGRPERLWDHRSGDCILLFLAVLNRVWPWEKRRAHNDLIGWQLRVLGTTYAVILGFMLYTVWTTYSEADLNVDLEADSVMRIYRLAEGLSRLSKYVFPFRLNETTRAYFERTAELEGEQIAADIRSVISGRPDPASLSLMRLSANPVYNAQLRTTCVATMLEAGHAYNALPQAARATVNCRILPGEPADEVTATLVRVLADDAISVKQIDEPVLSAPSALHEEIMSTIGKLSAEFWPGVPIVPVMSAGATDGSYLRNAGIPTYGHSGLASDVDDVRAHGRDERVLVHSFFTGQEYLYRLVKMLAGGR